MRMLCCPFLSPFNNSNRLPGGACKNSNEVAASSSASFLSADFRTDCHRRGQTPPKSCAVALSAKLLITACRHNVPRLTCSVKYDSPSRENFNQPYLDSALKAMQGIDDSLRAYGPEVAGRFAIKAVGNMRCPAFFWRPDSQ